MAADDRDRARTIVQNLADEMSPVEPGAARTGG